MYLNGSWSSTLDLELEAVYNIIYSIHSILYCESNNRFLWKQKSVL